MLNDTIDSLLVEWTGCRTCNIYDIVGRPSERYHSQSDLKQISAYQDISIKEAREAYDRVIDSIREITGEMTFPTPESFVEAVIETHLAISDYMREEFPWG